MPDNQQGGQGQGGGRGGNQKREDTKSEVALAIVTERLSQVLGRGVIELAGASSSRLASLVHNKELASALKVMGPLLMVQYGTDEEPRALIDGLFRGLADGIDKVPEDQVVDRVKTTLDSSPEFKKLAELRSSGRLDQSLALPLAEAMTYLDATQSANVTGVLALLNDKGAHLKSRFSPRELQGVAKLIAARTVSQQTADDLKERFTPPKSAPEKTVTEMAKAVEIAKKHLDDARKGKPGSVPFAEGMRAHTSQMATGLGAVDAVEAAAKTRAPSPRSGRWQAFQAFVRSWF